MIIRKKSLVVFSLEYNQQSSLLSHSYFWIKELKKYFDEVTVYAIHRGSFEWAEGIKVVEIGGGSTGKRFFALLRLFGSTFQVAQQRKQTTIFHHMVTEPLAIVGLIYRFLGVNQVLWYSHSKSPLSLRLGHHFVNSVVTPTRECFPLVKSKKVFEVGHGIDIDRFKINDELERQRACIVLGRISRVKNLHKLLICIEKSSKQMNISIPVDFYGPVLDEDYFRELKNMCENLNLHARFMPSLSRKEIPAILNRYEYAYNGNAATVDKSALESSLMGCFVITEVKPVQKLTGMHKVWTSMGLAEPQLESQISSLESLKPKDRLVLRSLIISETQCQNNLKETIRRIHKRLLEN